MGVAADGGGGGGADGSGSGGAGATTGSGAGDGGGATLPVTLVPQARQNFTLDGTSAPQNVHFTRVPTGGGATTGAGGGGATTALGGAGGGGAITGSGAGAGRRRCDAPRQAGPASEAELHIRRYVGAAERTLQLCPDGWRHGRRRGRGFRRGCRRRRCDAPRQAGPASEAELHVGRHVGAAERTLHPGLCGWRRRWWSGRGFRRGCRRRRRDTSRHAGPASDAELHIGRHVGAAERTLQLCPHGRRRGRRRGHGFRRGCRRRRRDAPRQAGPASEAELHVGRHVGAAERTLQLCPRRVPARAAARPRVPARVPAAVARRSPSRWSRKRCRTSRWAVRRRRRTYTSAVSPRVVARAAERPPVPARVSGGGGATLPVTLVPQAMQNFTLGGTSAPQNVHFSCVPTGGGTGGGAAATGAPHCMQNFMPVWTDAPQSEHVTCCPPSRLRSRSSTDADDAGAVA